MRIVLALYPEAEDEKDVAAQSPVWRELCPSVVQAEEALGRLETYMEGAYPEPRVIEPRDDDF